MNAFEQLKEVIEDARTRGGGYDAVVDAFSEIIAESDRLGDIKYWQPVPNLPKEIKND